MITEGQKLALKQLNEVNQIDNYGFDITKILEPDNDSPFLKVDLSIHCGEFKKEKGGLPLKEREKFRIVIPKDFPVSYPSIFTLHFRFAGWPHVQWKNSLCLYQSPDNEWNPEDGIYGYLDRLLDWLKHGALNELDPTGQPLHPPVTYRTSTSTSTIVPKVDTPSMNKNPWLGLARLEEINKDTFSITEWVDIDKKTKSGKYAAAILLPKPFPFEYPLKANELLREFKSIGISYKMFMLVLQAAIIYKESDHPLFLIVGTPMRGIKGEDLPKQHLSAWEFGESETKYIKISAEKYSANLKISEIGREMETILEKYLDSVKISWCRIFEDRPEIVNRRDINSNISVFKDKRITIWGCGAIGSNIAVYLARAGVGKLNLSDNDIVTPGIIVRQQYHEADIGKRKIDALEIIIKSINNNIEIEKNDADLKKWLSTNPKLSEQTDFVIDCTASNLVHNIFEKHFKQTLRNSVPIISMIVSSDCEKAISINIGKNHTGGIFDVYRKAALYACKETDLKSFADDFYPDKDDRNRKLFQPEPGCSDPTFIGSSSDSATLAGLMLDCASNIYKLKNDRASVYYISKKGSENFIFKIHEVDSDYITIDKISGYECRISKGAMNSISAEIKRNNRVRNESTETGGLLFGYRSMFLKTIWIDKATEPPPDSEFDEKFFKCGTSGTKTISEKFKNFSRGQTQFTGTWHTHPKSEPFPSTIDINGIIEILLIDNFQRKETLLLIVQPNKNKFKLGCYVLKRKDLEQKYFTIENNSNYTELENKRESLKNIGLALSGGGSRAIAFHLGCFRALNDRGLLEKINVISSVSGGSVISAMYAYKKDSFEDFDKKVIQLLKSGLDLKIAKEFLLSFAFLKEL
ncbi:MAG: hypothetical protein GWP19_07000, partial [Planctomycetia bacterium]|nr:hypothetical protein [Planctomycetia bacterium]